MSSQHVMASGKIHRATAIDADLNHEADTVAIVSYVSLAEHERATRPFGSF